MKQFLYVAPVILNYYNPDGVGKKILGQLSSFSKNYKSELIAYSEKGLIQVTGNDIKDIKCNSKLRRFYLYYYVLKRVLKLHTNYLYFRYHLSDPLYIFLLSFLRIIKCRIVIEIPTFPYSKSFKKNFNSFLKLSIDRISYPFLKMSIGRIVTYSSDDKIFGIKTIKTKNGIDYSKIRPVNKRFKKDSLIINLISVSKTYSCHGYDRIIRGLSNYYKTDRRIRVIFHIVGIGDEIPNLKALSSKLKMDKWVIFDGFQTGEKLDELYENSDMAINSIGIHRIGLKTESTLKAKEYCAKGLPIVSSYQLDSLTDEDNKKYVYFVPADDSDVDIDKIVHFYMELQKIPNYNMQIREKSSKIINMDITLQPICKYFNHNQ